MRGEKGFALVLTLVVTALMVAAAVELIHQVYVDTSLNRSFRDGQQASILAESSAYGGMALLKTLLAKQSYTSLSDTWALPFKMDDEIGRIEIITTEESGKINLNALVQSNNVINDDTLAVLKRLGAQLDIPESAWNALADWLDNDDVPRSGGAETTYYKSLSPSYAARNGSLATVNELSLVKGFTADVVNKLKPFVTVYPNKAGGLGTSVAVNVNTAPKEVLMALDSSITASVAERIMEERRLTPFKAIGELSRVDSRLAASLAKTGKVQGKVFRITAKGFVKEAARTVEAVVNVDGTTEILSWQEF
ncbi:general secretion pathway protein GspK [Geobacter sp. FeAm09]|uniref:type II secretion system minor pseudopilin GspK n=1 Tax=Geobacter sp. FeAm09 TaxID=2597769 RepID=UPI0011F05999|nr:type II secretion system minor pseudopilin GspK [Geobacter sp. FeAm09]QEM69899.1 general secretion pathway protein GspK [Geobacter sp. FeAm09]